MLKRIVLVTTSQALSSASNFLLIYLVSRSGSLREIGSLSIALLIFGLGTAVVRGALFRRVLVEKLEDKVASSAIGAAIVGVIALAIHLIAFVISGATDLTYVIVGVVGPLLYFQDSGRQSLLLRQAYGRVLLADGVWITAFLGATLIYSELSATNLVGSWVLAGAASIPLAIPAGFMGGATLGSGLARLTEVKLELKEVAVLRFLPFVAVSIVAAVVNFAEFGAWSGLRAFFGPLTVIYATMASGGLVLLARVVERSPKRSQVTTVSLVVLFPFLSIAVGLLLQDVVLESDFGPAPDVAAAYQRYIGPVALFVGIAGSIQALRAHCHAWRIEPARSLATQVKASIVGVAGLLAGAPFGMYVAAWTGVAGAVAGLMVWAYEARRIAPPPRVHIAP